MGLLIALLGVITLGVYLFPTPILWLLGDAYEGLSSELLLSIVSSCIGLLGGIVFSLYSARGWAMSPVSIIVINLLAIIIFASLLDLSSLRGVLYFNIGLGLIALIQTVVFIIYRIFLIKNREYNAAE